VIHVSEQGTISVLVTQERWEKARTVVLWIKEAMEQEDVIEFKTLESYRGFLVYVSRTYPMITPYLKGIHLSLDSWRVGRAADGWKLTTAKAASMAGQKDWLDSPVDPKAPKYVRWVPRLKGDMEALCLFTAATQPPKRAVRPARDSTVVYSFGDASGSRFGGSWFDGNDAAYRSGQWTDQYASQSSNYRELANLVLTLEQAHSDGTLKNSKVFIFTDNSTAESTFFRGTSSSKTLFELILRLQFIHMHGEVIVHFIHVAGKRMIKQGTDGLSRGTREGVLSGDEFLTHVPLHLGAIKRQPTELQEWVESWYSIVQTPDWLTQMTGFLGVTGQILVSGRQPRRRPTPL